MIHEDFNERIEEFERVLQKVATDMAGGVVFERLLPMDLWKKTEADVTRLRDLAKDCREAMLILKPERAHVVEQRFKAVAQPLSVFKDILFQKTADPLANSKLALEQLGGSIAGGSDFLILAKEIQKSPSPTISEILMLKRAVEEIEPVSPLEKRETPRLRPARLIWRVEALRASLTSLESALGEAKESLNRLREEILKYGYSSAETPAKEEKREVKETRKRQFSLSGF